MTVSIAKIENNTIVNIIVGSDNWEKMFSRDFGYYPIEELTGEIVIGATRSEDGNEFMPPEYLTEPPLTK